MSQIHFNISLLTHLLKTFLSFFLHLLCTMSSSGGSTTYEPSHPRLDAFYKQFMMYFILKCVPIDGSILADLEKLAKNIGFSSKHSPLFKLLLKRCKEQNWLVTNSILTKLRLTELGYSWIQYYAAHYNEDGAIFISEEELAHRIINLCD